MIETFDAAFRYPGGAEALRPASLRIEAGRVATIVGPNGSGKTTLLRILARVQRQSSGRVMVDGRDVERISSVEWSRLVGYLPQSIDASFPMRARDVVRSGLAAWLPKFGLEGEAEDRRALEALERLDALDLADRLLGEMSGGERKRVFLARVLVGEPRVLLLDEPLASLDVAHVAQMGELLRSLAAAGTTVVVVAHDFLWASAFSDEVIVMSDGTLIATGNPCETLTPELVNTVFGVPMVLARDSSGGAWVVPRIRRS